MEEEEGVEASVEMMWAGVPSMRTAQAPESSGGGAPKTVRSSHPPGRRTCEGESEGGGM